jgi:3'(2'), 5'-bisphosphate nucleotidase
MFDIQKICAIAKKAGAAIMEIYDSPFTIEIKDDKTPLTAADRASHAIIEQGLLELLPYIPVLSEEGREIPYEERAKWRRFWLVDPLDGTKEFIKRNGEFTVNIAFIEDGAPLAGVVHLPAQGKTYYGVRGEGAWLVEKDSERVCE